MLIGRPGITVDGDDKQDIEKQFVVAPKKEQSSENPAGEWNSYEIYCHEDTIRCYVNGVLQNEGINATKKTGWICLQSKGSPIEFRNIYIERVVIIQQVRWLGVSDGLLERICCFRKGSLSADKQSGVSGLCLRRPPCYSVISLCLSRTGRSSSEIAGMS